MFILDDVNRYCRCQNNMNTAQSKEKEMDLKKLKNNNLIINYAIVLMLFCP
jgi:hypothetical protein